MKFCARWIGKNQPDRRWLGDRAAPAGAPASRFMRHIRAEFIEDYEESQTECQ